MRTPPDDPGGEVVLRAVGSAIMSGGIKKKKKILGFHVGLCFWFLLSPKTCMPLCVSSFELLKM